MKKFVSLLLCVAQLMTFVPICSYANTVVETDVVYEQSFEGEAIPDDWTLLSGHNAVVSEIPIEGVCAKDGQRALRAAANAAIEKTFSDDESLEGTEISFYIYDDMSDTATAIMGSSIDGTGFVFGVYQSRCSGNYTYRLGGSSSAFINTKVARSEGWHRFAVDLSISGKAVLSVDGNEVAVLTCDEFGNSIALGTYWWSNNKENNVYIDHLMVTKVPVQENLMYKQSFEGDNLPGGWTTMSGKSTLSSVIPSDGIESKNGEKALKLGPNAAIERSFINAECLEYSKISFWIYDDLSTNAAAPIILSGDSISLMFGMYAAQCTNYYAYRYNSSRFTGTSVKRTIGWHQFTIDLSTPGIAVLSVDGNEVVTIDKIGVYNKIGIGALWYGCNSGNNVYVDYLVIEKAEDAPLNPDVESWHFYNTVGTWSNADSNTTAPICSEYSILSTTIINQSSMAGITSDMSLNPLKGSVVQVNVNPGKSTRMKLTFTTYYSANDLRDTTIWFDVTPNEFKTYTFAMSNIATWTNTIKKITIGFPEATAGETIYVDWVKAINDQLIHQGVEYTEFTPEEVPVERDFRVAYYFSDNMVLQRDKEVNIWGTGLENEIVTVTFNGQTKTATVGSDLKWQLALDPMSATEGLTMTITGDMGSEEEPHIVELNNVCVGEVWVLFGQSNTRTDMTASSSTSKTDAIEADFPNIRYARVRTTTSAYGLVSNTKAVDNVSWEIVNDAGAVSVMPGVAFYYSKEMYQDLLEREGKAVPVGVIAAGVSATNTEAWLPKEELSNVYTAEELEERASLPNARVNFTSAFYNGMIYPMAPMAFRGFIWYQGESSADTLLQATHHYEGLKSLISSYRKLFEDPELAFLIVQLPGYAGYTDPYWAYIRESQMMASQHIDNVGLAVTVDTDETDNLHPANKDLVGKRLYSEAKRMIYGDTSALAAPLYQSMKIQDNKIVLTFKNVGEGLVCPEGETLSEFSICGEDGVLYQADAKIISENQIEVSSAQVAEPKNVYYAFRNAAIGNLYNSDNIQASPFRTDMPVQKVEGNKSIPCQLASVVLLKDSDEIKQIVDGELTCNVNLSVEIPSAEVVVVMAIYEGGVLKDMQVKTQFDYVDGSRQYSFKQTVSDAKANDVSFKVMVINNLTYIRPSMPSVSFYN